MTCVHDHPAQDQSAAAAGRTLKLLVLDTSYTLEMIRARGLEHSVTCRDLGGFFEHVWTVHPFATLLTSDDWSPRYGRPVEHTLSSTHTFVEGRIGRYGALARFFLLNFLLSQANLFFSLARLIRKESIAAIRAGDPLYLGVFSWALARWCGIPLVVRVGGNHDKVFATTGRPIQPRLFRHRRIEKMIERFVFKRADLVAGANQDNLNFALTNGARPECSTLFRYGNLIDKQHFVDPASRAAPDKELRGLGLERGTFLMYIGRLEPVKQPDHLVRVLAELRSRGHSIKAVLVGDGQLRGALLELARELGVEEHIVLAGNRDQCWLSEVIPAAAAVLSPHTGRALSEAALAAAPIVAYDVDWQGEIIETDVTGALVPHNDWRQMADAVHRYLVDRPHARLMGNAVRRRALEMLDPEALDRHERQQYLAVIQRLNVAATK